MKDALHEGGPAPTRADLMPVAARAYGAVREAIIEKGALFGIDRHSWDRDPAFPHFYQQPATVRLAWVRDVMSVWLGGRSTHPDPWIRGIITESVRKE
jgi:hypothetical protein